MVGHIMVHLHLSACLVIYVRRYSTESVSARGAILLSRRFCERRHADHTPFLRFDVTALIDGQPNLGGQVHPAIDHHCDFN